MPAGLLLGGRSNSLLHLKKLAVYKRPRILFNDRVELYLLVMNKLSQTHSYSYQYASHNSPKWPTLQYSQTWLEHPGYSSSFHAYFLKVNFDQDASLSDFQL